MNPTIRLSPSDLHDRITSIEHAYRDGEIDRDERDALIREALVERIGNESFNSV